MYIPPSFTQALCPPAIELQVIESRGTVYSVGSCFADPPLF